MKNLLKIALLFSLLIPSIYSSAQCKRFTKKQCIPELKEYTFNGQLNTAVLARGEDAELMLSFYSGQKYRMYVCAEETLEEVTYKILDIDKNVIYSSEGKDSNLFDFRVPSTQQLIVQVSVPGKRNTHSLDFQGCVSVLIGFVEE